MCHEVSLTSCICLQVIEYIQVLQEKVRKFENVEQGRHQERLKSMVWDLCKVRMVNHYTLICCPSIAVHSFECCEILWSLSKSHMLCANDAARGSRVR